MLSNATSNFIVEHSPLEWDGWFSDNSIAQHNGCAMTAFAIVIYEPTAI